MKLVSSTSYGFRNDSLKSFSCCSDSVGNRLGKGKRSPNCVPIYFLNLHLYPLRRTPIRSNWSPAGAEGYEGASYGSASALETLSSRTRPQSIFSARWRRRGFARTYGSKASSLPALFQYGQSRLILSQAIAIVNFRKLQNFESTLICALGKE